MTYEEREKIFAKDYLTIADIEKLHCTTSQVAGRIIRRIKDELTLSKKYNQQGVRMNIRGKLHVQDYIDYYRLPPERYMPRKEHEQEISPITTETSI